MLMEFKNRILEFLLASESGLEGTKAEIGAGIGAGIGTGIFRLGPVRPAGHSFLLLPWPGIFCFMLDLLTHTLSHEV